MLKVLPLWHEYTPRDVCATHPSSSTILAMLDFCRMLQFTDVMNLVSVVNVSIHSSNQGRHFSIYCDSRVHTIKFIWL